MKYVVSKLIDASDKLEKIREFNSSIEATKLRDSIYDKYYSSISQISSEHPVIVITEKIKK